MRAKTQQIWARSSSVFLLVLLYYWIGYELDRSQFWLLFSLYSLAFGLSIYLYKSGLQLKYLIVLSFLFKFIFLVSIPELSQDFYRFIWDGMLNNLGLNPYLHLPVELIERDAVSNEPISTILFENMGKLSATNYSTYPPIAQLIYSFGYSIAGESLIFNVLFIRLVHLCAEVGLVYFGLKILKKIKRSKKQILFFILNPLVILESSFNLHFEVIMLFFLALGLYYLSSSKIYTSALGWAAAVASKMLPFMFLPLLFSFFNKKAAFFTKGQVLRYIKFIGVFVLGIILTYSFLWDSDLFAKNSKTLALYFTSFEFNASVYYVFRWAGYQWSGYNMISLFGKILSLGSLLFILFLSLRHRKTDFKTLLKYMLLVSTVYYLFSTTIHPWYLMLPLFLSIFTNYKYMLLWSWLVFLSYSAYRTTGTEENTLLIATEYLLLISFVGYEMFFKKASLKN